MVLSASNIERESKSTLAKCEKIQQRHQVLEAERDSLKSSIEELTKEKTNVGNKLIELEIQKKTIEGKAKLYKTQVVALENQKASLEVSLKATMEKKIDIQPLKKHALALRSKIHQMQLVGTCTLRIISFGNFAVVCKWSYGSK